MHVRQHSLCACYYSKQTAMLPIGLLPPGGAMLQYTVDAQLFHQPQRVPHRQHHPGNHGIRRITQAKLHLGH